METFLSELASELLSKHQSHLADICVVMPNRRAGLFLKKNLHEKASQTILAPDVFSIEDFLTHVTGLKIADNARLLFVLYDIHTKLEDDAQPLEEFIKTAQKMLADFNDIDKYLVDPEKLFGFLNEAKAIERWNPDGSPLTPTERNYLRFYQQLFHYYTSINRQLQLHDEAYQGMIYRKAAANIESYAAGLLWEKIYFAGFNALTPAEERVTGYLRESGKAEMIRDVDDYYISDSRQEAGFFFRKQLAHEGSEKFGNIGFHFKNEAKEIELYGTPGTTGQTAHAARILKRILDKLPKEEGKDTPAIHTALVPADEQLLIPLLSALPENPGKINVSMGYPLKLTPAYTFIISVFRLYENAERLQNVGTNKHFQFYYRDIVALMQQPFVAETTNVEGLLQAVMRSKQVFYGSDELLLIWKSKGTADATRLLEILLINHPPGAAGLMQILEEAVQLLRDFYSGALHTPKAHGHFQLQQEYLYLTATVLQRIRELNARFNTIQSVRALREVFVLLASASKLPFSGEPLEGIQIMGMLETRNLDFEMVVLIAANEGILPGDGKGNSFIPYDIRNTFNLPNHNHHNAVAAYHFYRLLQRAKEIHIIYNTEATQLGGGERSRFVQQLITEYPHYNPSAKITELVETPDIPKNAAKRVISVEKNDQVFKRLQEKAEAGFSPTSLNLFRRCSLQFYFQNIAGIRPAEEMEETIEHRTIGSIVHRVLELLYTPYVNAFISPAVIDLMKPKTDAVLSQAFEELYSRGQIKFGRNRLLFEVIKNFVDAFLHFEKKFLSQNELNGNRLRIVGLEKSIQPTKGLFTLPELPGTEINFRGSIDRVDELNGTIRIIDYKTGSIKYASELHLQDWDDFADGSKKEKPFQVMMYAWLYRKQFMAAPEALIAGVISLRNLSNGLMPFGIKTKGMASADEQIDDSKLEAFEEYLGTLFRRMFDSEEPFSQTDNLKVCAYCDFKGICNR